MIDVQGFIYWDAGTLNANWHQFSGWELHPLTAWKFSSSSPPVPFSVSASPANPQVGEPVWFNAAASNGTTATSFIWDFGDSVTASGSSVSHMFLEGQSFTVYVTMTDNLGKAFTTFIIVNVGSWNSGVNCVPALTTLEGVLGNVSIQRVPSDPASLGADYSGAGFKLEGSLPYGSNPTTWPFFKRDIQIPCKVNGTPTFVEFHNVTVVNKSREDCSTMYSADNGGGPYPHGWQSCDATFTLATPGYGDDSCPSCYMHRLYAGIDRDWNASGIAPPIPIEGQRIDIQGYIYWNNANVNATFHSFSGWELHPVTAWQLTHLPILAEISYTPSNPTSAQTITFNGTGSGGTGPYTFNWDFGNGIVATGSTATHSYAPGTYRVNLSAKDSHGAVGTASRNVTVIFPPDFAVSAAPSSITFPAGTSTSTIINVSSIHSFSDTVSLIATTSSGLTGSFSPNTVTIVPGGMASSTLTFTSTVPGTYTVSVIGTSGLLSHSANVTVGVVDVGPTVAFSESSSTTFRDQTIVMTISSSDIDGSTTSIQVNWGDGAIHNLPGNAVTDSHAYVSSGTFTVSVTAMDNAGLFSTASATNMISDAPPVVSFTRSPGTAPTGTMIGFDGSSSADPDGSIVDYAWSFGDGATGTGVNPSHSYGLAGDYTITLVVTDNATQTASTSETIHITDRPPLVSLTPSTTNSPTGTLISLAISTSDPDGTVSTITVSWGDGTTHALTGNATGDSHSYAFAGTYTVAVNATDNARLSATASTTEMVTDRPPSINFNQSPTTVPTGTIVSLTISAADPDGSLTGLEVNWGDGTNHSLPANASSDSHAYSLAGSYTITVTVTDDAGLTNSSQAIEVVADRAPVVTFTASPTTSPTGSTVRVTISAQDPDGNISRIRVAWGDGTVDSLPSDAVSDSHVYAAAGTLTVYVNATDDAGLTTTSSSAILTITDRLPVVNFTESSTRVPTGTEITMTINATDADGVVTGITVDWRDGTIDALLGNATFDSHIYSLAGSYTVTVSATDDAGLTGSSQSINSISDRPPSVNITETAITAPTGTPITLTISASDPDGTISQIQVDWGDGTLDALPENGTSAIHSYALAGPYAITVTATDDAGFTSSSQATIAITDRSPPLSFTQSPTTAPTGTPITLTISASDPDGTVSQIQVSWGNGTIDVLPGNAIVDIHSYSIAGSYTVTVTATDDASMTSVSQDSVTITDRPPTVVFTTSANTVPTGAVITLAINAADPDGTVSAIIVSWGDGTIDNVQGNATGDSHSYSTPGDYTAYANATDDASLTTQSSDIVLTITDRLPFAVLKISTTASQTLSNIGFNATGSFDPDGTIVGYAWNFGDGTSGAAFAVIHSYTEDGNYTVVLAVTDNSGSVGMVSIIVRIQDRAPTASFTFTPTSPLAGQVLGFDGSSSYDSDGTVIGFVWNFGDGVTSNGINASHAYATNGTYTVSLTVMDDDGVAGSSDTSIIVGYDGAPTWGPGSSIRAVRVGAHDVLLVWNGASDQVQVSSFTLFLNGTFLTNVPGSASGYTVAGLNPLSHYVFQVQAGNPSGNYSVDGPATTVFTRLSGDVNLDCQVDIVDLAMVGSTFGSNLGQPKYNPKADLNGDGTIDIVDLATVGASFGRAC